MLQRIHCLLLIFALTSLFGCSTASPQATERSVTLAPIPSSTLLPSRSPQMTLTASATIFPIESPTLLPTLEPVDAEKAIQELLQQDLQCRLPCFWGIIPGQTSLEETQRIYNRLNMTFELTYQDGDLQYYEARRGFDSVLGIGVMHKVEDGIVQSITVGMSNSKRETSSDEWFAYSPQNLMRIYGMPSEVEFNVDYPHEPGFPPGTAWYTMAMYFEEKNLIVYYQDALTKSGDLVKVCPTTDGFSGVGIWLGKNPHNPPLRLVPLEEATTLTKTQFYDLLTQGESNPCFDLISQAFSRSP